MTIAPGDLKLKDPDSEKHACFDLRPFLDDGVAISSHSVFVTGPDSALVVDNVTLAADLQQVTYRLTGGTKGRKYRVTCRWTTDEIPEGGDDRSIVVLIQDL